MPKKINYQQLLDSHISTLTKLQAPSGLFRASHSQVDTGYDKAWLRDNFYECLPFVILQKWDVVRKTYEALLQIFCKHEEKIDAAIAEKPDDRHKYIHARFHPETFNEFWEEWGNKQNDAVGAILFMVGRLINQHQVDLLDNPDKLRIVQKLVNYLQSLEYWHDPDSGIWEEDEEIHASSVGACLAGIIQISKVAGIEVNKELVSNGQQALDTLLPRESEKKYVDLALLSLIYPYSIVTAEQKTKILENIEYLLLRKHGVIRYKNDYYYNKNVDGYSEEAEWTFGLSWLAIIYTDERNQAKAEKFMRAAFNTRNSHGEIPELYYSNSDDHNNNSPLGWSEAMFIIAIHKFNEAGYRL